MNPIKKQFTEGEFTWFGLDFLSRYGDHNECNYVLNACEGEDSFLHLLKNMLWKEYV